MNTRLPGLAQTKENAKRLRKQLAEKDVIISHSEALELMAKQNGYRDWNSYCSAISENSLDGLLSGGRLNGYYMSQPFEASIIDAKRLRPGWVRLVLDLDEAVDVVTFEGFSNFRKRIRGNVGPQGCSRERTSNGVPHLQLNI